MNTSTVYFGPTTAQQRCLLFRTWEETGNVTQACERARTSRSTFYYWKPRFEAEGYAGLETPRSHAPHQPHRTAAAVEARGIELKQQHPDWGKRRIADEIRKENDWQPRVCANTVRRILRAANQWPP